MKVPQKNDESMNAFWAQLQEKPLLGDGAMGTLLFGRGVNYSQCLEALVVEQPALIAGIHAEYGRAGADLITTHTFGANRLRLAGFGYAGRVAEFNATAVALAKAVRAATGRHFAIAGNVGPVGRRVTWTDAGEAGGVAAAFAEQIGALAEAGVDLLLMETFSDAHELVTAVQVAKEISVLPVVASMSYSADGLTLAGQSVGEMTAHLLAAGADVLGVNCSVGPAQMVATLRALRAAAPNALASVTPNAGLPVTGEDGALHYPLDAQAFSEYVPQFVEMGARIVGGCCGTTPEYTAAMRRALDGWLGGS